MREHPQVESDLWALYRIDVRERLELGRMDLVLLLIERLRYEPRSLFRASLLGGDDWFGWGLPESLMASLVDGQGFQTQATAVHKKARFKAIVDRPEVAKKSRVVSTRDDVGAALRGLLS